MPLNKPGKRTKKVRLPSEDGQHKSGQRQVTSPKSVDASLETTAAKAPHAGKKKKRKCPQRQAPAEDALEAKPALPEKRKKEKHIALDSHAEGATLKPSIKIKKPRKSRETPAVSKDVPAVSKKASSEDVAEDEAAARVAREEAAREKRNAIEKKKAQNTDLRERFANDPSALTREEQVRAKQLIKVFEATEAARAKQLAKDTEESWEGSNEKKRKRQAEIATVRLERKLSKKDVANDATGTTEEHSSAQRSVRGGGTSSRGRGMSGRGFPSQSATGRGIGRGRGY